MIGISYYCDDRDVYYKLQLFDTKEEAKLWFIEELFSNSILHYWFEEDTEYYEETDIRNSLLKMDLEEIITQLKTLIRIQVIFVEK
jgi:hypothetical protein